MNPTSPTKPTVFPFTLKSIAWLCVFNTIVAIFFFLTLRTGEKFLTMWVFSMCIGSSISLLISTITILIWRGKKPHRPTFYLICILVAPVGYYLGASMALFIYNRNIPSVMSLLNTGNRATVVMTIFISLFAGAFFWNRSRIS